MKATKACPKCDGRRFVVSDQVGFAQKMYKGQGEYVAPLPVVARVKSKAGLVFTTRIVEQLGTYESWSCARCGYTELYAVGIDELVDRCDRVVG